MRLLCIAAALAVGFGVQAQEPVYRWGPPATNDFPERHIEQLLDLGDEGFVLLRVAEDATTVRHFWLERYDKSLQLIGTKEIAFNNGVMGNSFFLDDVVVMNGALYAFVSHWEKAGGKHTLMLHALGFDGVLQEGTQLDLVTAEKMGNRGTYKWSFSPDGKKLLLLTELPYVKDTKEKLRMTCYDVPALTKLWSHEQTLEIDADKALHNEAAVDNSGHAYLYKKIWAKPVWTYMLYATDGKGSWKAYVPKGLDGKQVEYHRLTVGPDGACFIYALYTTEPSSVNKTVHGSWYARFAADGTVTTDKAEALPHELVATLSSEHIADNKAFVDDLRIKDILYRADGKPLVLLEQLKSSSEAVAGSSPMQFTYEWIYGDAVALCLDPATGNPVWWQTMEKKQEVRNSRSQDEYGSFVYFLKADRLYMLWNNTDLSVPSIPAANWTEPDGTRYVKHKAFDTNTVHATFMQVIEPDGRLAYADRTFGLPLFHLHEGATFEMSMTTPFFFDLNGDLVILAMMHNGGKRYRFGFIGL